MFHICGKMQEGGIYESHCPGFVFVAGHDGKIIR